MSWTSSGPRTPCPCCGRSRTDKCRWRSDPPTIACWWGDRFSPPAGLSVGDVVPLADGSRWYVAQLAGGFGANSLILHPHRDRPYLPEERKRDLHRQRLAAARAERAVSDLRRSVHACMATRRPSLLDPGDFLDGLGACHQAQGLLATTRDLAAEARRMGGKQPIDGAVLARWSQLVHWQLADLQRFAPVFEQVHLGVPDEADIRALAPPRIRRPRPPRFRPRRRRQPPPPSPSTARAATPSRSLEPAR